MYARVQSYREVLYPTVLLLEDGGEAMDTYEARVESCRVVWISSTFKTLDWFVSTKGKIVAWRLSPRYQFWF